MIVGTFGQTLTAPGPGLSVVGVLIVWRVFVSVKACFSQFTRLNMILDGHRNRGRLSFERSHFI